MRLLPLLLLSTSSLGCGLSGSAPHDAGEHAPLGTFSRIRMVGRVHEDGTTTSGTEVLVVFPDRSAQIHHRDPEGLLIAQGTAQPEPFAALQEALSSPEWSSLPPQRGTPVPDGATHTIEVGGRHITRHEDPGDELVVRRATAAFLQIWAALEP